jgi:hypothetical protein
MKIAFGAMCPKLSEQIDGLPEEFDRDADAITRLIIRGFLSESVATSCRKKLVKNIEKWDAKLKKGK